MAKVDLKPLSLAELKSLKLRVEKAISRHDKKQKNKALAVVKAKAKEMGFSLDELTGGTSAKKPAAKKPAKAAYRHPDDASKTWAGRGARPLWLKDALKSGKSLEDFKV
ncbi:DNA-binding protein H-NS [Litoreibacter ascidiaceicola]|uniref:DNA-binding protein H-NS n=1 Tax=Litoreibacter ascidiaceicola TaxID=1486859 RepID=A0A1M5AM12_9RHOB|nr:H-NS histone family protein [Litoreibacter ascidiaceicola]SHF31184.1 DNA-binding protein H-NS [Litoreibacter ascidiaceicola]